MKQNQETAGNVLNTQKIRTCSCTITQADVIDILCSLFELSPVILRYLFCAFSYTNPVVFMGLYVVLARVVDINSVNSLPQPACSN